MPFEIVLALLVMFVAFPVVLFRGVARVRQAKAPSKPGLRASELRSIVADAVEEAVAPLHDRIDTLEGLLMGETPDAGNRSAPRIDPMLLDDADDPLDETAASGARRVRDA